MKQLMFFFLVVRMNNSLELKSTKKTMIIKKYEN